jgi:hypothetical protein
LHQELKTIGEYIRAVGKHWAVLIISLLLTGVDFVERIFGTWFVSPRWLTLTIGITGLIVAQYLAYRDFVKARYQRVTEDEISLKLDNDNLRHGVTQLEAEIDRLAEENVKLRIRPYDEAQRLMVQSKLKTYSDTERDLLRFLLQRGETDGQIIYKHSQDGNELAARALDRLKMEGLLQRRDSTENANLLGYWRINPNFTDLLRDLLFPREESQATPRFVV